MSNTQALNDVQVVLDEIDKFYSRTTRKNAKVTTGDWLAFVEDKWTQLGQEKYRLRGSHYLIDMVKNRYMTKGDLASLKRWIEEDRLCDDPFNNPQYIIDVSHAHDLFCCNAQNEAMELLSRSYAQNSEYISSWPPAMAAFFAKLHGITLSEADDDDDGYCSEELMLEHWNAFFGEDLEFEAVMEEVESDAQEKLFKRGVSYLKKNQEALLQAIMEDLLARWAGIREQYGNSDDSGDPLPDISDWHEFDKIVFPSEEIIIHPVSRDRLPYIGFEFNCPWDSEHGYGVMTHQDSVVEAGGADTALLTWIAEEDKKKRKKAAAKKS